jgi:predicted TIM-barrel enzyme
MNAIVERFHRPRIVLPVIHCIDGTQVRESVSVAMGAGADAVMLINQGGMTASEVLTLAKALSVAGVPVGVNLLGMDPSIAMRRASYYAHALVALWVDDIGVRWDAPVASVNALDDLYESRNPSWAGLTFGGVAFKYRTAVPPEHYAAVARMAATSGVDVVTTSGDRTGEPPTVDKIRVMREAIGDHALAIASGMTPENVADYCAHGSAFLVATGIESEFGWLDPARTKAMVDTVHGWTP